MKKFLCIAAAAAVLTACAAKDRPRYRAVRDSEIGLQTICPVTNNVFTVTKETKAFDYKDKTYYLCCEDCKDKFLMNLDSFAEHQKHLAAGTAPDKGAEEGKILYWTCAMHPQIRRDGPGECPICGMELIPVKAGQENRIRVDKSVGKMLNITSTEASVMPLERTLLLPARVAYDNDLYLAQQEYLSSYRYSSDKLVGKSGKELLDATRFRLVLLGYTDGDIKKLEGQGSPDENLILPAKKAWMFADIYEFDLKAVSRGESVNASVDAYPGVAFKGTVRFIEPAINPQTRSAKVRIEFDNPGGMLKSEMYASVEIKTSAGKRLAVPATAVIDTGMRKVVYLDFGDGTYASREVSTGFEGDKYVEITSGLKAGDKVVTSGNFMLDSESQLKSAAQGGTRENGGTGQMEGMDMGGMK